MNERVQTSLRLVGDWPWWLGVAAGLLLGTAAWLLYRRDTRSVGGWPHRVLPTLRALTVMLLVLMLCGPILHHRKTIGQLSRLWVFIDGSKSMELTDTSMELGRKVAILHRLGLLPENAVSMELPRASEALADAQATVELAKSLTNPTTDEWKRFADTVQAKIVEVRDHLAKSQLAPARLEAFRRELEGPAQDVIAPELRVAEQTRRNTRLGEFWEVARRWRAEVDQTFERQLGEANPNGSSGILQSALGQFDALPRFQRLQRLLLEGREQPLLRELVEKFEVQLFDLQGSAAKKLWERAGSDASFPSELPKPVGEVTNLSTGIRTGLETQAPDQRGAIVLLSDGQHNVGTSPIELARILAARELPIYTVGFGGITRPRDLAVVKIETPEAVFFEDRVRGQLTLKDDMPAGQAFTVALKDGERVLWEQPFVTQGKNLRKIPFEFPLGDVARERLKTSQADVQASSIAVELQAVVSAVVGESNTANNHGSLRLRAITQKRKVLLVDGRPRWESRYLRNLFERDEQWEINAVIAGAGAVEAVIARGDRSGAFPTDAAALATYDLIIFGDVPRSLLKPAELQWIQEFASQRGGAILFVDGPRGSLREYAGTPLEPLLPIEWKTEPVREGFGRLVLTAQSSALSPFVLASDAAQNSETWRNLPPPHWHSGATALAGSTVLLELERGEQKLASVVFRPFGAGKVLYHAFDDSWRWRYRVADQHHTRYWNQIANWIAELPFSVRDKFVSLDAGAITYQPGDSADLRVRLRDGEGKPVTNAAVDAVLYREGTRVATMRLAPDDNAGGLFRGQSAPLEVGAYEVAIESLAVPSNELKARAQFRVEPRETGELTQLSLNENLLREVAALSGGQYLREENISRLAQVLAPLSRGRVVESDTILWQSYWWFVPIILLLATEWIIRKRTGLL